MDFRKRFPLRLWRPAVDDEVNDELEFHLAMRRREFMQLGLTETQATRAALEKFGDYAAARQVCRAIGHQREQRMRILQYVSELRQDVSFAVRQMLAAPGFTVIAVTTLSIGIGATTAIFSAMDAVVLRPLPVAEPERVVHISASSRVASEIVTDMGLPNAHFLELASEQQAFTAVAAMQWASFTLSGDDGAERVIGARVTGRFFEVFRIAPAIGGVFGPAHDTPGSERVVVLSHRLWAQRFGADPSIVGRDILLNQRPHTVLGIMPESFTFTATSEVLWVPMAWTAADQAISDEHNLVVVARLRDDVTVAQANEHVAGIAARRRERQPDGPERWLHVSPLLELYVADYRNYLFVLLGAVACVLLIGCGNVSNLLLARGTARARELAMRSALGAGQGRLVRQLLAENMVLGLVAAAVGALLAYGILNVLVSLSPPGVPRLERARIDGTALGVAVLLGVAATILAALIPAWRAAQTDVNAALKDGGRGAATRGRDRVRSTLVAGEVALALVLMVAAGLLIRSALETRHVDPGFDPQGLYSGRLLLPQARYPDVDSVLQVMRRLEEAVAAIPGVSDAALAHTIPSIRHFNNGLVAEGRPNTLEYAIQVDGIYVSPNYFRTVRQRIVRGRGFLPSDGGNAPPVTIINETLARQMWPGEDPIGKRVHSASPRGLTTIVGIAADVRAGGPAEPAPPTFYVPLSQLEDVGLAWINRSVYLIARTEAQPDALAAPMRRAVSNVDPTVAFFSTMTLEERLAETLRVNRFSVFLLTSLGLVGLLLAGVGIYGVIAYFASQRTPEIGVRMALGATRTDVIRLVIAQATAPVLAGLLLGTLGAIFATRLLGSQLVNVRPTDPLTYAGVSFVLLAVGMIAAFIPARRAARLDPMKALHAM